MKSLVSTTKLFNAFDVKVLGTPNLIATTLQNASIVEKIISLTPAKNLKVSQKNAPYAKATTQPTIEDARFIKNFNQLNNQKEKLIISKKNPGSKNINVNLNNVNTTSNLTTY